MRAREPMAILLKNEPRKRRRENQRLIDLTGGRDREMNLSSSPCPTAYR
jgi:hypothetical protein